MSLLYPIKAIIWTLRLQRWERLHAELIAKEDFSRPAVDRIARLRWKMRGAKIKIAKYVPDLSGG